MPAFAISTFMGMFPRTAPRLLAENQAQYAVNARTMSGYLAGRERDEKLVTVVGQPRRVRRVEYQGSLYYLTFVTPNVDVVKAPLVNDQFDRYYWAGEGIPPSFNTAARIAAGQPAYKLGILGPTSAPVLTITAPGDTALPAETRFYVHTFVDEYGQESQPSAPSAALSVHPGATVEVAWGASPLDPPRPTVTHVRIYRTVPGATGTSAFFFVTEQPVGSSPFEDDLPSSTVALNETLPSANWNVPPADMAGMAAMPNGFLVGFRGRDILFSEPFRPYAWPTEYTLSVEDDIVGIAVFDTNCVILTKGVPYIATGVAPEAMSLIKVGPTNACVARRSIVAMPGAVVYASEDGLVAITVGGNELITREIVDRDTWRRDFSPDTIIAARDGDARYVAFVAPDAGFEMDFREPGRGIVLLTGPDNGVQGVDEDAEGRRALLMSGSDIYTFSTAAAPAETYVWRSRESYMTKPVNLGAAEISSGQHRGADPANPDGMVRFRMWADDVLTFDEMVPLNQTIRLPTGYKAQVYEFEFEGDEPISRFAIAEQPYELALV